MEAATSGSSNGGGKRVKRWEPEPLEEEEAPAVEFRAFMRGGSRAAISSSASTSGNGTTFVSDSRPVIQGGKATSSHGPRMRQGAPRLGGLGLGGIAVPVVQSSPAPPPTLPDSLSPPLSNDPSIHKVRRKQSPRHSVDFSQSSGSNRNSLDSYVINNNNNNTTSTSSSPLPSPPLSSTLVFNVERPFLSPELPKTRVREGAFPLDRQRPIPPAVIPSNGSVPIRDSSESDRSDTHIYSEPIRPHGSRSSSISSLNEVLLSRGKVNRDSSYGREFSRLQAALAEEDVQEVPEVELGDNSHTDTVTTMLKVETSGEADLELRPASPIDPSPHVRSSSFDKKKPSPPQTPTLLDTFLPTPEASPITTRGSPDLLPPTLDILAEVSPVVADTQSNPIAVDSLSHEAEPILNTSEDSRPLPQDLHQTLVSTPSQSDGPSPRASTKIDRDSADVRTTSPSSSKPESSTSSGISELPPPLDQQISYRPIINRAPIPKNRGPPPPRPKRLRLPGVGVQSSKMEENLSSSRRESIYSTGSDSPQLNTSDWEGSSIGSSSGGNGLALGSRRASLASLISLPPTPPPLHPLPSPPDPASYVQSTSPESLVRRKSILDGPERVIESPAVLSPSITNAVSLPSPLQQDESFFFRPPPPRRASISTSSEDPSSASVLGEGRGNRSSYYGLGLRLPSSLNPTPSSPTSPVATSLPERSSSLPRDSSESNRSNGSTQGTRRERTSSEPSTLVENPSVTQSTPEVIPALSVVEVSPSEPTVVAPPAIISRADIVASDVFGSTPSISPPSPAIEQHMPAFLKEDFDAPVVDVLPTAPIPAASVLDQVEISKVDAVASGGIGYTAWRGLSAVASIGSSGLNWGWNQLSSAAAQSVSSNIIEVDSEEITVLYGRNKIMIPGGFRPITPIPEDDEHSSVASEDVDEGTFEEAQEESEIDEARQSYLATDSAKVADSVPEEFLDAFQQAMAVERPEELISLGPGEVAANERFGYEAQDAAYRSAVRAHAEAASSPTPSPVRNLSNRRLRQSSSSSLSNDTFATLREIAAAATPGEEEIRAMQTFEARFSPSERTRYRAPPGLGDSPESPTRSMPPVRSFAPRPASISPSIQSSSKASKRSSKMFFGLGSLGRLTRKEREGSMESLSSVQTSISSSQTSVLSSGGKSADSSSSGSLSKGTRAKLNAVESDIGDATYVNYASGRSAAKRRSSISSITESYSSSPIKDGPTFPSSPRPRRSSLRRESKFDSEKQKLGAIPSGLEEGPKTMYSVRFGNAGKGLGLKSVAEEEAVKGGGQLHAQKWIGVGRGRYGNLTLETDEATDELYAVQAAQIKQKWRAFGSDALDWASVNID